MTVSLWLPPARSLSPGGIRVEDHPSLSYLGSDQLMGVEGGRQKKEGLTTCQTHHSFILPLCVPSLTVGAVEKTDNRAQPPGIGIVARETRLAPETITAK